MAEPLSHPTVPLCAMSPSSAPTSALKACLSSPVHIPTMDPSPAVPSLQLFSLAGKNVLITGATRGIGAACAIALAEAGANICLVRRPSTPDSPPNNDTINAIAALGVTVKVVHCDLADLDAVKSLFPKALDAMAGEIHVLVNCAGIQRRSPAVQFSEVDWDDVRLLFFILPSYSQLPLVGAFRFGFAFHSHFDSSVTCRGLLLTPALLSSSFPRIFHYPYPSCAHPSSSSSTTPSVSPLPGVPGTSDVSPSRHLDYPTFPNAIKSFARPSASPTCPPTVGYCAVLCQNLHPSCVHARYVTCAAA
ncbi:2-dehydro-3-deoxy-D-gluconate 5-dehydrogenase [Grifola frondosa]|uniref:3-oxoacyl-[acyl-carrier-protein] reductase n=1 Tax=Grifola frondosa TaxID=5627 RepID=A0A1C7LS08_GRIFR|nr:2-dehydro-3-deoxy-D-gluconate 5-dehydrogenase [Grifola frondosa]